VLEHVAGLMPQAGSAVELARVTLATERDEQYTIWPEVLERPLWMVEQRADCADFEMLGLLHLWKRTTSGDWPAGLRERVGQALRAGKYWIDQPGLDAMCYFTENHQLVWHSAEMLAGEALPDDMFANTGWSGRVHAEHGRALAREWIARKLASGFSEFDSNAYLAIDTLALASIVEFAADRALAAMAAGLLDKLLFTLATNSWHGVHGSPHGLQEQPVHGGRSPSRPGREGTAGRAVPHQQPVLPGTVRRPGDDHLRRRSAARDRSAYRPRGGLVARGLQFIELARCFGQVPGALHLSAGQGCRHEIGMGTDVVEIGPGVGKVDVVGRDQGAGSELGKHQLQYPPIEIFPAVEEYHVDWSFDFVERL
jgi:hypothetical protein